MYGSIFTDQIDGLNTTQSRSTTISLLFKNFSLAEISASTTWRNRIKSVRHTFWHTIFVARNMLVPIRKSKIA